MNTKFTIYLRPLLFAKSETHKSFQSTCLLYDIIVSFMKYYYFSVRYKTYSAFIKIQFRIIIEHSNSIL